MAIDQGEVGVMDEDRVVQIPLRPHLEKLRDHIQMLTDRVRAEMEQSVRTIQHMVEVQRRLESKATQQTKPTTPPINCPNCNS